MSKREFVGYIVQCRRNGPMRYGPSDLARFDRTLWTASWRGPLTVFHSKADAYKAIRATLRYAKARGYNKGEGAWTRDQYVITRLEDAGRWPA